MGSVRGGRAVGYLGVGARGRDRGWVRSIAYVPLQM